jgi:pimeloyl-ACP methyl ester carboxylesterase
MGTLPLIETAARHPERVDRIVLLGTSLPMAVSGALLDSARADDPAAYDRVNLWGHSKRAQLGGSRAAGIWVTGAGLRLLERSGPGVLYNDMNSCNEYQTGLEAAGRVACPVVLILGESDRMTPARNAHALRQALPKSRSIVLKGSGHMMMAEQPDETLDALIDATRGTP